MHSRVLAFNLLAFLVACRSASSVTPPFYSTQIVHIEPAALPSTLSGHLYVADHAGIQRFPIARGLLSSRADLLYPNVSTPIILDSTNHLYATSGMKIYVYVPGSTKVARTVTVPSTFSVGVDEVTVFGVKSLATDNVGRLYVAIGARFCHAGSVGCSGPYGGEFVLVYASNANANASPASIIQVSGCTGSEFHALLDASSLVVDQYRYVIVGTTVCTTAIYTIAGTFYTPETYLRTVTGSWLVKPNGIVLASGELYIDITNGPSSFVAAIPATANGSPVPREISVSGEKSFGRGIAIADGVLFTADPTANAVYAVSSLASGVQKPLILLHISAGSPTDVKVGL